ncbi:LysR family transcriptional regulator [Rhodanobacter sp. Si-c]|uniref:LysR family transcriptional regulator n=1 Tax=Rhodanobacter lycopersici TaxID=3162487 RepID=A0ABV3QHI7_9GAMM
MLEAVQSIPQAKIRMGFSGKANGALFDLDLLRALLAVADCGSFTAASARLHSTQSTVSQKVRRLEDMAGHELLVRGKRDVRPTDQGEKLLAYARRMLALNGEMLDALAGTAVVTVRLGVPEDFVAGRTTRLLAGFSRRHPQVKLEVTTGLSRDLARAYDRGELELVLVKQRRDSREAVARWPEKLVWIDSARHPASGLDPLPLVAFPPHGLYRDEMIKVVEGQGRDWRISFTSSSLFGVQAAVAGGLGISLLPARAATPEHRVLTRRQGLPPIDSMDIAMLHRPMADPLTRELAGELARMLAHHRR